MTSPLLLKGKAVVHAIYLYIQGKNVKHCGYWP